jgi:phosphoribosyl-AMP cyclohydrolase / phosphoribosyl-ATP pyrophosphohydrolase
MELDFEKGGGLLPAIVQHAVTRTVLMLGFMNADALAETQASGKVTFFSRTKGRLWTKGESSGHFLQVVDIKVDCDQDTLLIQALPAGPVCHTGSADCFDQTVGTDGFLYQLQEIIRTRAAAPPEESYTARLLEKGRQKIAQKVGEEAVELILEAQSGPDDLFLNETADMLYHLMVLLHSRGLSLADVEATLAARHR